MTRELEKSGSEKSDLTSKIEEITLYNDNSERELRNLIKSKQVRNLSLTFLFSFCSFSSSVFL